MKNGRLAGFVDFELSERNVRLFDPCCCATAILSESINVDDTEKLEKWPEIFMSILSGYDSVCRLTPEEYKAAFYVVLSIQMICVAYFGSLEKFELLAGINRRMLTWIYENRERLKDIS
jgi:Ser/Thr protein kinase RdoA (MazF antagonist)